MQLTPMMQQYMQIKQRHQDAILFYRLGDFYEMFFDDAKTASRELDLVLTSRDKQQKNAVPLCGVPHHAAQGYISKLLSKGYKVAICEQTGKFIGSGSKKLVQREVTQVMTPGIVSDPVNLQEKQHNFLLAIIKHGQEYGLACVDVSTGSFHVSVCQHSDAQATNILLDYIARWEPKEIIMLSDMGKEVQQQIQLLQPGIFLHHFEVSPLDEYIGDLQQRFSASDVLVQKPALAKAVAGILEYLQQHHAAALNHINHFQLIEASDFMALDEVSVRNLELLYNNYDRSAKHSLLDCLDHSCTPMGARLLKQWLLFPLNKIDDINARLDAVESLVRHASLRESLHAYLQQLHDMERIACRSAMGQVRPQELSKLRQSLSILPELKQYLADPALQSSQLIKDSLAKVDDFAELHQYLCRALSDELPLGQSMNGTIRAGFHDELDELRSLSSNAKDFVAQLEQRERKTCGISSLKVRYNKVFGYYIEVTKTNLDRIPEHYQRKQTLANAERYITDELKEYENKILSAEERITQLEQQLFEQVKQRVAQDAYALKLTAQHIAVLDVLQSFAQQSQQATYVRPQLSPGMELKIRQGRHPVLEQQLLDERFVPNDLILDPAANRQCLIITGPNMAGKSTVMRQNALIAIMAHMGCFVPAEAAEIGIIDRIFTRVGAADHISKGQSTFMVEMIETAHILKNATHRSLIILDEIGRGTSTFDGLSIAWAVAEHLHDQLKARCLFATHYHELTELAQLKSGIVNVSTAIKESGNKIIFLRHLVDAPASQSFGIHVARLAGIPTSVVRRAQDLLKKLEAQEESQINLFETPVENVPQANPYRDYVESVSNFDINAMTPLECMNALSDLQERIKNIDN